MFNPDEIVLNCHEGRDTRDWQYPTTTTPLTQDVVFSRRDLCPKVLSQGSIGSCVGQSGRVVFGEVPVNRGIELSPMCVYKTAQLYDIWPGEDYSGTSISGACKGLLKDGVCLEEHWPYGNDAGNPGYETEAAKRKVHAYYSISLDRVEEIKELLKDECIWFAVRVYNQFFRTGSDGLVKEEGYLDSGYAGGHAMAIIGYKETAEGLFWEVQNSWGHWWGENGYCWIPHSLLCRIIKGPLYVLITNEEHHKELEEKRKEEEEARRKKEKDMNIFQKIIHRIKEFLKKIF